MSRARKEQSAVTAKSHFAGCSGVASRWSTSSCSHCSAQKQYHEAMGCCPSALVHSDETQRFSEHLSGPLTSSDLAPILLVRRSLVCLENGCDDRLRQP